MEMSKEDLIIIIKNAIAELEFSEYEHLAILEYLGITEEQYKYFKEIEL